MARKFEFYQHYGVEKCYVCNPEHLRLQGWQRQAKQLVTILQIGQWISPWLGICFHWQSGQDLVLYRLDGQQFLSPIALELEREQERQRAERAKRSQQEAVPCLLNLGLSVEQVASTLNLLIDLIDVVQAVGRKP